MNIETFGPPYRRLQAARERVTLPSIHGDRTTTSTKMTSRSRSIAPAPPLLPRCETAKLKAATVLHTPPENRLPGGIISKPSPLKSCHFCGRGFGNASLGIHEKLCGEKLLRKHAETAAGPLQAQHGHGPTALSHHRNRKAVVIPPHRGSAMPQSWEPFTCECQYCGGRYGQHSIAMHAKSCSIRQQQTHRMRPHPLGHQESMRPHPLGHQKSMRPHPLGHQESRPRRTMKGDSHSVSPTCELAVVPRPGTRTLNRSLLTEGGHDVPTVVAMTTDHTVVCERCGGSIPSSCVSVHSRICGTKPASELTGRPITFPSQVKMTVDGVGDGELKRKVRVSDSRGPPTVVCYICGREYGTKSISIHEPQCLRKWQTENSKLPISERKPLPKKNTSIGKKPSVLHVMSREETVVIGIPASALTPSNLEKFVESYYLQSYEEFERDLQPCSKCGRTFAPEIMVKHAGRCKAEPLRKK